MKALATILFSSCVLTLPLASAAESADALRHRCDEQERQIRRLELENSRLRELLTEHRESEVTAPSKKEEIVRTAEATAPSPAPAAAKEPVYHTVKSGETLSVIARKHSTSTSALVKLNGLRNAGLIRIGQKLRITAGEESKPTPAVAADTPVHKVAAGETFYSIARRRGLSVDDLSRANPEVNPNALRIGQSLKLSRETSAPAVTESPRPDAPAKNEVPTPRKAESGSTRTVSQRTTVRSIRITEKISFNDFANRYGASPAKLNALNGLNLEPGQVLAEGSELYIPAQP